ncbi:MAG: hypothetical protein LW824_18075 [Algoriphagus sp.]|nr:hypothetical protein [Algoriphagus sp.]
MALAIGTQAPDFTLTATTLGSITLSKDLVGLKKRIVFLLSCFQMNREKSVKPTMRYFP